MNTANRIKDKEKESAMGWRLPTQQEAIDFIHAASRSLDSYDLKGLCWTSTPYHDSKVTAWSVDFNKDVQFERCLGSVNPNHGYFHACIRLVRSVAKPNQSAPIRFEDHGVYIIDTFTGLAWHRSLLEYDKSDAWVGEWIDAPLAIKSLYG